MNKPQQTRVDIEPLIAPFNRTEKVIFLGIRGYFANTMGKPGVNDIGIYDDAIFILGPTYFGAFNANVDPSRAGVGIASLKSNQVLMFTMGLHGVSHSPAAAIQKMQQTKKNDPFYPRTYWAFRQASNATVTRNGKDQTDSPANRFWIDLHCGGEWTTSSEGCQTIIKEQWQEFKDTGYGLLEANNQTQVPYILIDNPF